MRVTIEVTAEDIASGTPGSGCDCPIAIAVRRALPHLRPGPWVYSYGVGVDSSGGSFAELPEVARDFINRFDAGEAVEPFSFDLDVPDGLMAVIP